MFYVCKDYLDFTFICNTRKLKKQESCEKFIEENESVVKVQVKYDKKSVFVQGFLNDILIFHQRVPFIKNQKYSIYCKLNSILVYRFNEPTHDMFFKDRPNSTIDYCCIKELHPKTAKKLFKKIKRDQLVSKPCWDNWIGDYDWKCKACNYSWVSNPDHGYVYPIESDLPINNSERLLNLNTYPDPFKYKGKKFQGIFYKDYNALEWYNEKEYNEKAKWYYEHGLIVREDKSLDADRLAEWKKDWPPFETLWKSSFISQKEINENGNSSGGAWRREEEITEKTNNCNETEFEIAGWEKVVTKGWHKTKIQYKNKNVICCPVCSDLNKIICNTNYSPLNFFQKRKVQTLYFLDELKFKVKSLFHKV